MFILIIAVIAFLSLALIVEGVGMILWAVIEILRQGIGGDR